MKTHARVVVIGGGCVGVNILYALTKRGWTDVVLLERTELTAGSTWHAAGLIPLYSFSHTFGRLINKSIEVYESIEAETGQSPGWHKCGQLRIANSKDRMDEYLNYISIAPIHDVRAEILSPAEVRDLCPLFEGSPNMLGGLYHPDDGHIAPADVTQAMAAGARQNGAQIYRNTEVSAMSQTASGEWLIQTNKGDITCEHVVTATGNYGRQTGRMVGLDVPCVPILHQYWVTEAVQEVQNRIASGQPEMPVLRDESINGYIREERESLMFGPYERPDKLELFAVDGVPDWFGADLLPEDFDSVQTNWEAALKLVPALGKVGIKNNVRGPICTTPDNLPLVGPAFGLKNYWLAEGCSGGILMGAGLGHFLSAWIVEGDPGVDMAEIDSRRYGNHANKHWVCTKAKEAFGHNFGIHYPGYEWPLGRPAKTAPDYERLSKMGAVWGAVYGWEVPTWFAPDGVAAKQEYGYRRTNAYEPVKAECRAVREGVGLFEMTPMTKFEVSGKGAGKWLDSILANRMPTKDGRIALAHLLTNKGGVRSEFTVTRLAEDYFYLIATPRGERHDFDVLQKLLPEDRSISLRNVTLERGCLTIVGPKARDVLQQIAEVDLSNESFPWLTAQSGAIGFASDVRMLRVNYEGELGWELYHPISQQLHLLEELLRAGESHGLKMCGYKAIESLRLEKSYRAMYRDMNVEHTALETGLDRFICLDKEAFIGKSVLLEQNQSGLHKRMVTLAVDSVEADAYMNEGVWHHGKLVGRVSSGAHSNLYGYCLSMAYVPTELSTVATEFEIAILGEQKIAVVIADSPYDPENLRPRM